MVVPNLARRLPIVSSPTLALIALLLAAFALRVYRLDWDEGRLLHPDELHVVDVTVNRISFEWPLDVNNLLDPASSRLNPRSDDPATGLPRRFAYGALPVLVTDFVATILEDTTGKEWTAHFGGIHKVGRALSATLDTCTVALVFLIGHHAFSRRVALLGATIYAFTPLSIQLAHFYTTDTWLTFFVALTLWLVMRAAETGRLLSFTTAGASFGLAMASKASVPALFGVIAVAAAQAGWQRRVRGGVALAAATGAASCRLGFAAVAAIASFAIFEPYALARPLVYLDQLREQSRIVRGVLDVPFTRQYVGTTPLLYQLEQLMRWGMGPVTGIACLLGVTLLVRVAVHGRNMGALVLSAWLLLQGVVVMTPETKFLRYAAPLLPALAVAGGLAMDRVSHLVSRRISATAGIFVAGALLVGTGIWTASFVSIYANQHPRLEASRWIYANVPSGSSLGVETWDEALPVPLGMGLNPWDFQYQTVSVELYLDRPPEQVANDLYQTLEQVDYIILASNRVSRGVQHLPWRYPVQIRYYQLLEEGALGFDRIAEFRRDPGLGRWRVNDQAADESFVNYDHPRVIIYQKRALIPRDVFDELMASAVARPWLPQRHPPRATLMLEQPVGELPVVADARWSASLTQRSGIALGVWVLLLVGLHVAGLPLAQLTLGRSADGGWGLSRLLALLVAGYLVWIAASLEVIAFRTVWVAVALLVVGAIWLIRPHIAPGLPLRADQRRCATAAEVVFWSVFVLFLLYRWINPDSWHPVWGGEKPMEFAHLNAILRSAHFPPYDPWYANGYVNYYYYGLYLVAFCVKLTGIPSEIAFNLAQPTIMALLASAGFSVAATLGRGALARRSSGLLPGLLGVLLLVGVGNLHAFFQVVRGEISLRETDFFSTTWAASRAITGAITEFPYFTGLYADLHAHVVALPITVLIIGVCHAIASQTRLLPVALSRSARRGVARWTLAVRLGVLAIALGTLSATNAWDVPVYAALALMSLFMATGALRSAVSRLSLTLVAALAITFTSFLLFSPFYQHYVALFGSLGRVREPTDFWEFADHLGGLLILAGLGLCVALLGFRGQSQPRARLSLAPLAVVVFLLVGTAVASERWERIESTFQAGVVVAVAALLAIAGLPNSLTSGRNAKISTAVALASLVGALVGVFADRLVMGLLLAVGAAGTALWLRADRSGARFTGVLVAAAAFVAAGVEVVYLADDLSGHPVWYRMNTVFKFYNQVWVLLAMGGAALLALMTERAGAPTAVSIAMHRSAGLLPMRSASVDEATSPATRGAHARCPSVRWARMGLSISVVALLASLTYPVVATKPRLEQRFPGHPGPGTLNALDWMRYGTITTATGETISFAGDLAAIRWFNENIAGAPVIAEASIGPYRGNGSRISNATGLPTILGWERHQYQQRYAEGVRQRWIEVRALYDSPDLDLKRQILRKYDVAYVVVGDIERKWLLDDQPATPYASEAGIAAFDAMVGTTLEIAFSNESTVIYRVLPPPTDARSISAFDTNSSA